LVLLLAGTLLGACAGASSGGPGSAAQMPKQDCAACMQENPGDVVVCERICHEHSGILLALVGVGTSLTRIKHRPGSLS